MSLKFFKSYTKSTRSTVLVDRKNLWKGKSLKSLTVGKHSSGGRNNLGRITSRSKGAGHKHKFRGSIGEANCIQVDGEMIFGSADSRKGASAVGY